MRISIRVLDAVRDSKIEDLNHVFMTGHSLGGAVAAISENYIRIAPSSVCLLGAPRYSDLSAYATLPLGPPAQVRRPGDLVPTVPPRVLGYADHPYESTTSGSRYIDPNPYVSAFGGFVSWARFLIGNFKPHLIEDYRRELGKTAGARGASYPLAPLKKLVMQDIGRA